MNPRYKPVAWAAAVLAGVWLLAWAGFSIAGSFKMTAEKFSTFASGLDLAKLNGDQRARALRELADKLNRLSAEERRQVRLGQVQGRLFNEMTDAEKGAFIEATMPTGFKQMLSSFEQLPAEKRRKAIDGALRRLRTAGPDSHPPAPPMSDELQKKIVATGLKTFYQESSAQTKAEVAPLLEELQRMMESGRLFHGP
jgi:hypothetical protein